MSPPRDELTPLERCIQVNGNDIFRYLQSRSGDAGDAAEAYGETLLTAWRARRRLPNDESEARMWLFVVARNVLSNNKRSDARRSAAVQRLRDRIAAEPQGQGTEQALDIRTAIDALPPELAEVIRLTYWDGLKSDEVAALMGISASTARNRVSAARQLLKNSLSENDESAGPTAEQRVR